MKTGKFVLSFLAVTVLFFALMTLRKEPEEKIVAEAMWVSSAQTIRDLTEEADVIVRVKVASIDPTRLLIEDLPISAKAQNDYSDEPILSGEYERNILPFTDTNFEVLEVYKGDNKLGDLVTVAQTGGLFPADAGSERANRIFEFSEDPLYKLNEEYVLFLWDVSGDKVHAPDRELYLVMTPFARYRVKEDATVYNYSNTVDLSIGSNLPENIEALEEQILSALTVLSAQNR